MSYAYRAARNDGEIVRGTVRADSSEAAVQSVATSGLYPIEVREAGGRPPKTTGDPAELARTFRGLAALFEAGMPADRALDTATATATAHLALPLLAARDAVREGASLSSALETAGVESPVVVAMVRAGERSGDLAGCLGRAALELEHDALVRERLRSALTYPAVLGVAGAASCAVIVGFVIPRFTALLGDAQLPAATRLLMGAGRWAANYGLGFFAALAIAVVLLARWCGTPSGALALSRFLHGLPIVGPLKRQFISARICGALATMLDSGVPVLAGLGLARAVAGDGLTADRLGRSRDDVERGDRLAVALHRHAALTPLALSMLSFGESSGRVTPFLAHAAAIESSTAQDRVRRLVALLEPCLILLFALFVALVAVALLQAVYSVRPTTP